MHHPSKAARKLVSKKIAGVPTHVGRRYHASESQYHHGGEIAASTTPHYLTLSECREIDRRAAAAIEAHGGPKAKHRGTKPIFSNH